MTNAEFWQLVDGTIGHENRTERLAQLLDSCPPEHLVGFRLCYDDAMQAANTVDLRAACQIIHGFIDDDLFFDFREALIELGQATFANVVVTPDALADLVEPDKPLVANASFNVAVGQVWTLKTGQDEDAFFTALDAIDTADRSAPESGDWWDFNDHEEVTHRLPRLAAKFLGG